MATFFPITDFVRIVGGEHVRVSTLIPLDGDLHTFAPTARQMRLLQEADVVFALGLDAEPFLEAMLRGLGRKRPRVVELSEGCRLICLEHMHSHEHTGHAHAHEHGVDPHVWLSLRNAMQIVRNVQIALQQIDPAHSVEYRRNADSLVKEIQHLYLYLKRQAATWRQKKFIAAHGAYRYLAEEAGIEQVAVFEPVPGVEPSARWLRDLIRTVRREQVRAIFAAPPASSRLVEVVAADLGVPVYLLDPLERTLGIPGESYLTRMKRNIDILNNAMR